MPTTNRPLTGSMGLALMVLVSGCAGPGIGHQAALPPSQMPAEVHCIDPSAWAQLIELNPQIARFASLYQRQPAMPIPPP